MQVRHRIPTIFNISMVDVLCCALGCVILLWLLNLREAKEETVTAGKTREQLKATQTLLGETASRREQTQHDLEAERVKLAALHQELVRLRAEQKTAEDRLAKLTREQRALTKEKADASQQVMALEDRLSEKEGLAKAAARRIEKLEDQLHDAAMRAKELQALADQVPGLRAELVSFRSKLAAALGNAQALEKAEKTQSKDLADANRRLAELEGEKKLLTDQASRALAAFENRFEGITLTGRRVVFWRSSKSSFLPTKCLTCLATRGCGSIMIRKRAASVSRRPSPPSGRWAAPTCMMPSTPPFGSAQLAWTRFMSCRTDCPIPVLD